MVYLYTKTNEELSSFDETISVVRSGINGSANILFSTENRRCFRELEHIKCSCNPGDIIIISNFESLGMNDTDIKENLDWIFQKAGKNYTQNGSKKKSHQVNL